MTLTVYSKVEFWLTHEYGKRERDGENVKGVGARGQGLSGEKRRKGQMAEYDEKNEVER